MSFADRILINNDPQGVGLRSVLRDIPVVDVSAIGELFWTADEEWLMSDFPNSAPPWRKFWLESRHPSHVYGGDDGKHAWSYGVHAWGALVEVLDADTFVVPLPDDTHWMVRFSLTVEGGVSRELAHNFLKRSFAVRRDGSLSSEPEPTPASSVVPLSASDIQICRQLLSPLLLSLSFMHCKNVTTREVVPPPALSKAREKRKGVPLLRYHELVIEPMKQILRTEGRSGDVGTKQALHLCRGHFKDYRKSGLFGRHKDLFWWDPYARGDANKGVIVKDYAIGSPVVSA